MAYFPKVDPVNITPIDLGEIQKNNLLRAMYQERLKDMSYDNNARNALNSVLQANPSATGQNVLSDMATRGYGEAGQKYAYNWMNRQQAALKYQSDLRTEVSGIIGSVTDENSKNQAIDHLQSMFPDSDFSQYRAMPWQQAKTLGNNIALGATGRVKQERVDNTLTANGLTPGQDPGTLHTITTMQKEADADAREKALFPGKVQQQTASLEHTNLSNESLRQGMEAEQKVLVGPGGIRMRPDDAYAAFQKGAFMNPDMTFADFLRQGQFRIGTYNPRTKALTLDEGQPFGSDGAAPPQGAGQPGAGGTPPGGGQAPAGFGSGAGLGGTAPQPGNAAPTSAAPQTPSQGAYVQKGNGQALTPAVAAQYAKLAGGNRSKAEWMAKSDGWVWPQ